MTVCSRRLVLTAIIAAAAMGRGTAQANDDPEDWTGKKMPADVEALWKRLTDCRSASQEEARLSAEGSAAQQRAARRKADLLCAGNEARMDRLQRKYRHLRYVKNLFDTFRA